MIITAIQISLTLCAGAGLFLMWRSIAKTDRTIHILIAVGLILRAIAGQLAFWISYLHLPIARSQQMGDGLWLFGSDSPVYYGPAVLAAAHGPLGIFLLDQQHTQSLFYVQALAAAVYLFGAVTSVALLVNVAAYLITCAAILRFDRTAVAPIAFISLSPSAILWSLQPMKDVFFACLLACYFAAALEWQRERRRGVVAVVMFVLLYAITSIRWYFGLALLGAMVPYLVLSIVRSPRKGREALTSVLLLAFLALSFPVGTYGYSTRVIEDAMAAQDASDRPAAAKLAGILERQRTLFEVKSGTTTIGSGRLIQRIDAALGAHETLAISPEQRAEWIRMLRSNHISEESAALLVAHLPGLSAADRVLMPATRFTRALAGCTALVVPRWLAQEAQIIDIRGGRGLWPFVEIDTLVFDLALLFAIVSVASSWRSAVQTPVFWLMLIVTPAIGFALAYMVTNYGTLFRHRNMVLTGIVLLMHSWRSQKT